MYSKNINKYEYLVLILFSLNIFFWDINFGSIQLRFFYLILTISLIFKFRFNKEHIKVYIYFFIFLFLLFLHLYLNSIINNFFFKNFVAIILIFLTSIIIWENFEYIKKNFIFIIDFYLFVFVLIHIFFYIYNYEIIQNTLILGCSYQSGIFSEKISSLEGMVRIYTENSHFAMTSSAIICYYVINLKFRDISF